MQTQCIKKALRRENDSTPTGVAGNMYLMCDCGHKLSIPTVAGLPLTYVCLCGTEYDSRGYILNAAKS